MIPVELGPLAFMIAAVDGMLAGFVSVWIFRRFTDAEHFRSASNQFLAHLFEFRLFSDEPAILLRAQQDLLRANARLLRQALVPSIILVIPIALLMFCGDHLLARAPLRIGDPTVLTSRSSTSSQLPDGLVVETPSVWVTSEHQAYWRVRPLKQMAGTVKAGSGVHWISSSGTSGIIVQYPPATVFGVSWLVWFFIASCIGSVLALIFGFPTVAP